MATWPVPSLKLDGDRSTIQCTGSARCRACSQDTTICVFCLAVRDTCVPPGVQRGRWAPATARTEAWKFYSSFQPTPGCHQGRASNFRIWTPPCAFHGGGPPLRGRAPSMEGAGGRGARRRRRRAGEEEEEEGERENNNKGIFIFY